MKDDGLIITDSVLDLSDVGAAQETLTLDSSGIDTITISGLDYASMATTITLPSTSYGAVSSNGSNYYTTGTGHNYSWNTVNPISNPIQISTSGIDMGSGTDIKIDGKSLKTFMDKMEERLAILVPDPNKLEKFEALKKAYDHYKLMEKLCQEIPKEEED